MKIPNGRGQDYNWVDVKTITKIFKQWTSCDNCIITTSIKEDGDCERFYSISNVWSLEKLLIMCDLNGMKPRIYESDHEYWKEALK